MSGTFIPDWKTALTLQDQGRALEALRHFRAIGQRQAKASRDPAPLLETARRLALLYDFEAALPLLATAARHAGQAPEVLLNIAVLLRQEGLFAESAGFAARALKRAKQPAHSVDALLLLAECAERLGQPEEALACASQALKTHPGSIPARRIQATVLRRGGRIDEALTCLQPLLAQGGPAHWETCRAWFELGHLQDAAGNYEAAWQAWTTARRHYPPGANWTLYQQQAEHVWKHVRLMHASVTRDQLMRWAGNAEASPGPRTAILTGHPRSGTTLLEQALDAHSGIISAEETTVFTSAVYRPIFQHAPPHPDPAAYLNDLSETGLQHYSAEYHGLMRLALRTEPGPRLLLDKNPDLLQLLPAALRLLPGVKIIVMLRDPRDILVSMFSQALPPNHTSWSYRNVISAGRMVAGRLGLWQRLRGLMPESVFHEIKYESAAAAFPAAVQGTLDFLGLPAEAPTLDPAAHSRQKVVHSPTYAAVQEPVHTRAIGRWRNYDPWIAPALADLNPAAAALGYQPD